MKLTMKTQRSWVLGGAFCLMAGVANANLIENGSFENPDISDSAVGEGGGTGWKWFLSDDVDGWNGSNVEIWNSDRAPEAYHGDQHAELNSHPDQDGGQAFTLFQDITTVPDQTYDLFFAYRARNNGDEEFLVTANDYFWEVNDHSTNEWSLFEESFVAYSESTRIQFTSVKPETGLEGNFIDDVRVTSAKVPAPATLTLLGLGLLGMGASKRFTRKSD